MPLAVGSKVGDRYVLEGVAGEGASAKVFRATDSRTGKTVAIKAFNDAVHSEEEARWLARELKALSVLDHPNVVRMLDASATDSDEPWICTEWLDGSPCDELVRELGPVPEESVIGIAMGALAGLEAAHQLTIVHRDIKPANLYLCKNGRVVLLDFGVARALTDKAGKTLARSANTSVVGTPTFLAPEQLADQPTTSASDVYALGVSLRFMLSGAVPFRSERMLDLMRMIMKGEIAPLPKDICSQELRALLDSLVDVDPKKRPTAAAARKAFLAMSEAMPGFQREFERFCRHADETTVSRAMRPTEAADTTVRTLERDTDKDPLMTIAGEGTQIRTITEVTVAPDGTQVATHTAARIKARRSWMGVLAVALPVLVLAVVLLARPKPGPPRTPPLVGTADPPPAPKDELPAPTVAQPIEVPAMPTMPQEPRPDPTPKMGTLQIAFKQWGTVKIDGKDFGRRQLSARFELPPGRHHVVVDNPQYGGRAFDPIIRGGQTQTIEVDFKE